MAYISDLRFINGQWIDNEVPDYLFGTQDGDTINVYAGNNSVSALGGNDTIFDVRSYAGGYSGADFVSGGEGNDLIVSSLDGAGNRYHGDAGTDTLNVIPNGNGAFVDLAGHVARDRATGATSEVYTIENVVGSAWNDYLYGDANSNKLSGYNGDDLIRGQAGNDNLNGGRGRDVLFGGAGTDSVYGEDDGDMLYGDAGNDFLNGGNGDDYLFGGTGLDHMVGGAGSDDFVFKVLADGGNGANADQILDFRHLVDDMDVSTIDANVFAGGNQAFRFIGGQAFNAAGQIRAVYNAAQNETVVLFNTDNDTAAEMTVKLDGNVALSALDFIL